MSMQKSALRYDVLRQMRHHPVDHYIIPGLTSWKIASSPYGGCVRMFEMHGHQLLPVAPHSHRFDFTCHVLAGSVVNTLYEEVHAVPKHIGTYGCFEFNKREISRASVKFGEYNELERSRVWMRQLSETAYSTGDSYHMSADEIHTVRFSFGAVVLFVEGPEIKTSSAVYDLILPDGNAAGIDEVKPWMFKKLT